MTDYPSAPGWEKFLDERYAFIGILPMQAAGARTTVPFESQPISPAPIASPSISRGETSMHSPMTTTEIHAANQRLRQIMNDRRILGLELAAMTFALEDPSRSASSVIDTITKVGKASGFNRAAGLSAAIDELNKEGAP